MYDKKVITPHMYQTKNDSFTEFLNKIGWGESYSSLLLGILVVILGSILFVSFVRGLRAKNITLPKQEVSSTKTIRAIEQKKSSVINITQLKNEYTVVTGDSLWSIAQKQYNSGYNWVDIANANSLSDSGIIYAGTKLTIPNVETKILVRTIETQEPASASHIEKITSVSYTVVKGDDLWDIAVRAYADGYRWVDIAKVNNLSNPDIIFSDTVLKIPR